MGGEKYITLAIHTYDRAVTLRSILESHGLEVKFEKLVITGAGIASGVRVKINERDLPLALKLTESAESIVSPQMEMQMAGSSGKILMPVDFSPYTMMACRLGFALARRLNLHPVILYAYATPYFTGSLAFDDTFDGGVDPVPGEELADMEAASGIRKQADRMMRSLRKEIEREQESGTIEKMQFTTMLNEGVAEDVIKEYCRLSSPALVVMATRGKDRKESDLIGSVTAEVLDSCRVPVFAVPENWKLTDVKDIKRLVFFCNLDQHDIMSIDTLMRLFNYPDVDVTLVPVNERAGVDVKVKVETLRDYFNKGYPAAHFYSEVFPAKTFMEDFANFAGQRGVQMLIVPNKKRNILSRLFNPGIAHKILFERDMPLLSLPV